MNSFKNLVLTDKFCDQSCYKIVTNSNSVVIAYNCLLLDKSSTETSPLAPITSHFYPHNFRHFQYSFIHI